MEKAETDNNSTNKIVDIKSKSAHKKEAGMTQNNSGSWSGGSIDRLILVLGFMLTIGTSIALFAYGYGTLTNKVSTLEANQISLKTDLNGSISSVKTDLASSMNNNNVFLVNSINSVKTDLRTDISGIQSTLNQLLLRK